MYNNEFIQRVQVPKIYCNKLTQKLLLQIIKLWIHGRLLMLIILEATQNLKNSLEVTAKT